VTTTNRLRRAARSLAGAGALAISACVSPGSGEVGKPVRPQPWQTNWGARGQDIIPVSARLPVVAKGSAALPAVPPAATQGKPLPIDLPTALALTDANPLDVQIAGERLRIASAAFSRARVMWLPNINSGVEYFRHDGQIQAVAGDVFTTSKSSLFVGAGPTAVFSAGDAYFAPLAARQVLRARQADAQAARNDTTLAVAEAYFTVQQARGEVAGAIDALRRAEELVKLTEKVAPELAPTVEVNRAKAEVARRRIAVETAYERWQVASADLTRLLRLQPGTLVEPAEEPALAVELIDPSLSSDELVPVALTNRPELAAHQALIQAALVRVRQEQTRPLVPSVALRGVGSQVPGLAGGLFGGGVNGNVGNFGGRFSFDLQAIWELQNLGFGNRAVVRERQAEQRQALLELLRTQDIVTAEVVQAHAQLRRAANRLRAAEDGVTNAAETAEKNLRGLVPGKRVGEQLTLVFRPQEAVAAVAALDQAYRDYYAAVGDHNRAQFRLYRALGHPAQCLKDLPTRSTAPVPAAPQAAPEEAPPAPLPPVQPTTLTAPAPRPPALPAPRVEETPAWHAPGSP
jgi:outer membrane protein TolC